MKYLKHLNDTGGVMGFTDENNIPIPNAPGNRHYDQMMADVDDPEHSAFIEDFNDSDNLTVADHRARAYGSVQDQLDMLYWDQINGTTKWKDHITAVKVAHPK
tara:strand:+ start:4648 stop:4956 length:309 start_codon:yes stop_codon:yes gene_type:complete